MLGKRKNAEPENAEQGSLEQIAFDHIVRAVVTHHGAFRKRCGELWDCKPFVLALINRCPRRWGTQNDPSTLILRDLSVGPYDDDIDVAVAAIQKNPYGAMQNVSDRLRDHKRVALAAVGTVAHVEAAPTFGLLSDRLKRDMEVVIAAVAHNPVVRSCLPDDLGKDKDVVASAIEGGKRVIRETVADVTDDDDDDEKMDTIRMAFSCVPELGAIKDVMMMAVRYTQIYMRYASEELRHDEELVRAAVQAPDVMAMTNEEDYALAYAANELRQRRDIVMLSVGNAGCSLESAPERFCMDRGVVLAAVASDGLALELASEELRGDKEVVLAAVAQDGGLLAYASDALRGDKEVVLVAVKRYGDALKYASEALKGDKEVVLTAVTQNMRALRYASSELKKESVDIHRYVAFNVLPKAAR